MGKRILERGFSNILIVIFIAILLLGGFLIYKNFISPKTFNKAPKVIAIDLLEIPITQEIINGFKDEMTKLGYQEGQDVVYKEEIFKLEDSPKLDQAFKTNSNSAVDLMLILDLNIESALKATQDSPKKTPIVFVGSTDEQYFLQKGIVKDLKSSGNNSTGVFNDMAIVVSKQLEFLRRISPNAKKIGVMTEGYMLPMPTAPALPYLTELKIQAPKLGFTIVEYKTKTPPGPGLEAVIKQTMESIKPGEVDAWVHLPGHFIQNEQVYQAQAGKRLKIPVVMPAPIEVEEETGGLFSYGENFYDLGAQAATIADKILKGTDPADIPIEFPRKYEFVVNLNTAREIGVVIPDSILSIVDRKIE